MLIAYHTPVINSTALSALFHFILYTIDAILIPTLQMRKLRRERFNNHH